MNYGLTLEINLSEHFKNRDDFLIICGHLDISAMLLM